ncbi:hypothetical protein [Rhodophyticola porphyridii]|uniref:Curlin n=1 Tax=Rhodophyticola porphyridii TaxID=1852017 RepID=A0A3L9YN93_9RHOB|nr:hypothetical protein [Rhodophyticola porphyridii]RMA44160.1 hypothetical protein D9R08_04495 [Rhodophyticola porphyridii]
MSRHAGLVFAVSALVAAAAAHAEERTGVVVDQHFDASQIGLNTLDLANLPGQTDSLLSRPGIGASITQNNTQLITNAANILISQTTVVESAEQIGAGQQLAGNTLTGGEFSVLSGSLQQTGENLTNVIIAERVDSMAQQFGPGGTQAVENLASLGFANGSLMQTGRNTANIVVAEISIGAGSQVFPFDSIQSIDNFVRLSGQPGNALPFDQAFDIPDQFVNIANGVGPATAGTRGVIVQEGTNLGNILISDEVHDVVRVFNGEQIILNNILVEEMAALPQNVTQSGINIANFVSAIEVSGLVQFSEGVQSVENDVTDASLASLTAQISEYNHVAENYANVLYIRNGEGGGTASILPVTASQGNTIPQSSESGNGRQVQVGNAAAVER